MENKCLFLVIKLLPATNVNLICMEKKFNQHGQCLVKQQRLDPHNLQLFRILMIGK